MNIAYLIHAHHQPDLLKRLVDRLNQNNTYFFIHVDAKSKYYPQIKALLGAYTNVQITSIYKVYWMGISQVEATIHLFKQASNHPVPFKYQVLLSGQDYPIKNNEYINTFFENNNADFISYNKMSDLPVEIQNKVKFYFFMDNGLVNPRSPKHSPLLKKIYYGIYLKRLCPLLPQRKMYNNWKPYFGSNWFALTQETIDYLLKYLKENPKYLKFMSFVESPDESFFQTLICNTSRVQNLYGIDEYKKWESNKTTATFYPKYTSLRYMDWSENLKEKPATLDDKYFAALENSNELFARKFDEKRSGTLLDLIDQKILC